MNLAVIPARGGSKRIPKKNIKSFRGKPMIAWSIQAAQKTGLFSTIVVSTDDEEIAQVAREWGAAVPSLRPANLADDFTPTVPVIAHAVQSHHEAGGQADYVCCIYPCAPFVVPDDIVAARTKIEREQVDFVFPVTDYPHPIQRAMTQQPSGKMQFLYKEHELTRTQDLQATYHDVGQFYWGTASAWLAHKKMHTDGVGLRIPHWRVVDIDNEDDWRRAELLFQLLAQG